MKDYTVVFDLDGTLVDTAPDLMAGIDLLLTEKGLAPVPQSLIRPLISVGSRAMLKAALTHHQHTIDADEFDAWWQRYLEIYAATIADRSRPFPGLVDLLERLRRDGARLAVCTNKAEGLSRKLLGLLHMETTFHAIAGRDTFPNCFKPDPEHVLGAIRLAGGTPQRAVMVGDSDVDIAAARNANVPVIAVTFGYVQAPIASFAPDAVIGHYDEFEPALASIRSTS